VPRDRRQERRIASGEPAQIAVPRQYEPRIAHAAECDPRLFRTAGRRHLRRGAREGDGRLGAGAEQRQTLARLDQRCPRFVEDRGRAAGAHCRRLCSARCRAVGGQHRRGPGQYEGAQIQRRCGAGAADRAWRCAAAVAGLAEPGWQRGQIHRRRRGRDPRDGRERAFRADRARYRPWHRAGGSRQDLWRVPAGRQLEYPQEGRHRAGPRDLKAHGRDAGRLDRGRVRARPWRDVPRHPADPRRKRGGRADRRADGGGMTKRILVVEDTEDNRQIIRDLMTSAGYELIEAVDGIEGVATAEREKPDLILMDIQLPGIDGYEATRRIRMLPELAKVPIIAVTSYALSGDEAKTRAAGCDGYVAKPFSPRQLLAKVREFLPEAE